MVFQRRRQLLRRPGERTTRGFLLVMGILIESPWVALLPAALFLLLFARSRKRILLVVGLLWLAYLPYEYAMKLRILCSGECNIRIARCSFILL
jgi:hypothetical protein